MNRKQLFQFVVYAIFLGSIITGTIGCSKSSITDPPTSDTTTIAITEKIRPIVFAHGQYEAADAWTPFSQLFGLNGYAENSLYAFDFEEYFNGTIPNVMTMATQLQSKVNSVIQQTGTDRVDIVAHGVGAQAVQYYITKLEGTKNVAHVAFLAGIYDTTLALEGNLTPWPIKFITVRSDGQDATQGGDLGKGGLLGATNTQVSGLDHQQMLETEAGFASIFQFFCGQAAKKTKIPATQLLRTYNIKGRVISFFDNKPVPNASVKFYYISADDAGRQSTNGWRFLTSDANGYFSLSDTVRPISKLEIAVEANGYSISHIYRQSWRENSMFERVRVLPKPALSGASKVILADVTMNSSSAVTILFSPYRAIYNGRDQVYVRKEIGDPSDKVFDIVNPATAPTPGSGAVGSNTTVMFLYDALANQTDGSGPTGSPALNQFFINSYDIYFSAAGALTFNWCIMNNQKLNFQGWRSVPSTPGSQNQGISILQYDWF